MKKVKIARKHQKREKYDKELKKMKHRFVDVWELVWC